MRRLIISTKIVMLVFSQRKEQHICQRTSWEDIKLSILFEGIGNEVMQEVLANIYTKIGGIYYVPHNTKVRGMPYVECGDVINVQISERQSIDTYVFKRTMKGVQSLTDTYEADGKEYHSKLYEVEEWTE